jgi:hypothetical protein
MTGSFIEVLICRWPDSITVVNYTDFNGHILGYILANMITCLDTVLHCMYTAAIQPFVSAPELFFDIRLA